MHHEDRRAVGPTAHDPEPARVGGEQTLQLLLSIRLVSREQDVRHALALEVSAVHGGWRLDHVRAPIARDVSGTATRRVYSQTSGSWSLAITASGGKESRVGSTSAKVWEIRWAESSHQRPANPRVS